MVNRIAGAHPTMGRQTFRPGEGGSAAPSPGAVVAADAPNISVVDADAVNAFASRRDPRHNERRAGVAFQPGASPTDGELPDFGDRAEADAGNFAVDKKKTGKAGFNKGVQDQKTLDDWPKWMAPQNAEHRLYRERVSEDDAFFGAELDSFLKKYDEKTSAVSGWHGETYPQMHYKAFPTTADGRLGRYTLSQHSLSSAKETFWFNPKAMRLPNFVWKASPQQSATVEWPIGDKSGSPQERTRDGAGDEGI
jgi:hypothetical protein